MTDANDQSTEFYRHAFEDSGLGMGVVSPEGRIIHANAALCKMFGRPRDELVGVAIVDITHPDDREIDQAPFQRLLRGEIDSYRIRKRYLLPDGGVLHGGLTVSCTRDACGSARLIIGQVSDLTAQVAAEQALAKSEARYRFLTENMKDVVWTLDPETLQFTYVSPSVEALRGYTPAEVMAEPMDAALTPEGSAYVRALMAEKVAEFAASGDALSEFLTDEIEQPRRDGSTVWTEVITRYFRDADTGRVAVVGVTRDVSERKRVEGELAAAHEQLELDANRLEAMIDSLLDPLALLQPIHSDHGQIADLVYTDVNQAACDYLAMTREELIGASLLDMLPGVSSHGLLDLYDSVLQTGEPLSLDDFVYPHHEILGSERRYDIRAIRLDGALVLTWRDVTNRYLAYLAVKRSEERFRLLAENSSDVVMRLRTDNTIEWVSPSIERMLGWSQDDWLDREFVQLVHPDDVGALLQMHAELVEGRPLVVRLRLRDSDDEFHWVALHAGVYRDDDDNITGAVVSFRTIDVEVAAEQELRRRAYYDELTGMLSRREILERVAGLVAGHERTGDRSAVMFMDVDHLRDANERYGHAGGDKLLATIAQRIEGVVRQTDIIGRIGGDEFLVVLSGVHGVDDALAIAEKVRIAVSEPIEMSDGPFSPGVSIGVSLVEDADDADHLLERADKALMRAKAEGRDRVVLIPAG